MSQKPKNKAIKYNCALHYYQGLGDFKKAKEILDKMLKEGKGSAQLDEKVYKLLESIEKAELKKREEAMKQKRQANAKKAAAKKAAAAKKSASKKEVKK